MADWAAVASAVNQRMAERRISQKELSDLSGISVATLRQIQQGMDRRRSVVTLGAISRALGFPDDHLRRLAFEGSSTTSDAPAAESAAIAELRTELDELRQRVEDIESRL